MISTLCLAVTIVGLFAVLFCLLLAFDSISQGSPAGIYLLAAIFCFTLTCPLLFIALTY